MESGYELSNDRPTGYELSRQFFDFCFENPEIIRPIHSAIYFFAIEHCNRLGWKSKFGFPSQMAMDAIGVRNWRTYIAGFNDLVDWGFFDLIEKSKNQYSSNIIAIVKNTEAHTKALDKALQKHLQKHSQKQSRSIASIDKQLNKETKNHITVERHEKSDLPDLQDCIRFFEANGGDEKMATRFFRHYNEQGWIKGNGLPIVVWQSSAKKWIDEELFNPGRRESFSTGKKKYTGGALGRNPDGSVFRVTGE